jgi:hypothetical protein
MHFGEKVSVYSENIFRGKYTELKQMTSTGTTELQRDDQPNDIRITVQVLR